MSATMTMDEVTKTPVQDDVTAADRARVAQENLNEKINNFKTSAGDAAKKFGDAAKKVGERYNRNQQAEAEAFRPVANVVGKAAATLGGGLFGGFLGGMGGLVKGLGTDVHTFGKENMDRGMSLGKAGLVVGGIVSALIIAATGGAALAFLPALAIGAAGLGAAGMISGMFKHAAGGAVKGAAIGAAAGSAGGFLTNHVVGRSIDNAVARKNGVAEVAAQSGQQVGQQMGQQVDESPFAGIKKNIGAAVGNVFNHPTFAPLIDSYDEVNRKAQAENRNPSLVEYIKGAVPRVVRVLRGVPSDVAREAPAAGQVNEAVNQTPANESQTSVQRPSVSQTQPSGPSRSELAAEAVINKLRSTGMAQSPKIQQHLGVLEGVMNGTFGSDAFKSLSRHDRIQVATHELLENTAMGGDAANMNPYLRGVLAKIQEGDVHNAVALAQEMSAPSFTRDISPAQIINNKPEPAKAEPAKPVVENRQSVFDAALHQFQQASSVVTPNAQGAWSVSPSAPVNTSIGKGALEPCPTGLITPQAIPQSVAKVAAGQAK